MTDYSSREWWDSHHEAQADSEQAKAIATALVPRLQIPFSPRTLIDFGCGAGGAMPSLRARFLHARLIGVDFSPKAIALARKNYPWAEFICGDHESVPKADAIMASNIIEHLANETEVVDRLLDRCLRLFIAVPYQEHRCRDIFPGHCNFYERDHYLATERVLHTQVFPSYGWAEHGLRTRPQGVAQECLWLDARQAAYPAQDADPLHAEGEAMKLTIIKDRGLGMTDPLDQVAVRYVVDLSYDDVANTASRPEFNDQLGGPFHVPDVHPIVNELWALLRIAAELSARGLLPPLEPKLETKEW